MPGRSVLLTTLSHGSHTRIHCSPAMTSELFAGSGIEPVKARLNAVSYKTSNLLYYIILRTILIPSPTFRKYSK